MTDFYWRGGTGTWDNATSTNWSLSSGGAGGAGPPTGTDNAIFDAASDSGAGFTVTTGTGWTCKDFDATAVDQVLTFAGSAAGTITGSLKWPTITTRFNRTYTGTITYTSSASEVITSGGNNLGTTIFNGTGSWAHQDSSGVGASNQTMTLTQGTHNLNGFTVETATYNMNNSNNRVLAFGTGKLRLQGANTTVFNCQTITNASITGTPLIELTYTGGTGTRTFNSAYTANPVGVKVLAGTDTFTNSGTGNSFGLLDFTGFAGTLANIGRFVKSSLTYSTGMTVTSGANTTVFNHTSGTAVLTSNGIVVDVPHTMNGAGGTLQLGDNLNLSTRTLGLTSGNFDANNKNVTVGAFSNSNSNTRVLGMGNGLWTITGSGTAFDCATSTGLTVSATTATVTMTSASAKTFAGGGKAYGTINQGGAGNLSITGANTFADITNTVQPASILFTAATTTTFAAFSLAGTAGNLITIDSITAATHTLTKPSGTVNVSYCTIAHSIATGGATWTASTTNGNVDGGSNTGWLFAAIGTTISVVAATLTYSGQAIIVNAQKAVPVTAAVLTYSGQAIVNNVKKFVAVIAAVLTYTGQAITSGPPGGGGLVGRVWDRISIRIGLGI